MEVGNEVKRVIEEVKKELPPGVQLELVRDNSVYIRDAVNDVRNTLIEGSVLAVLTVFLFLRDWRSTLISALAIPTSIIATFFAMKMLGFTLNFMSLMALSLAVGLLIDDAIVVIENIVRHLRMGKSPWMQPGRYNRNRPGGYRHHPDRCGCISAGGHDDGYCGSIF
ncbi:hypothetical protein P378_20510 [Desulforamulus profundi]|uniref:Acriflavin resistance protein n=1 Tax=Desulforamulus profundi TaxID=1383067 RepID=A0A2C6M6V8_9FIRM|nr:hypothetical protein P378_20510 [Desulforamulus profundi]